MAPSWVASAFLRLVRLDIVTCGVHTLSLSTSKLVWKPGHIRFQVNKLYQVSRPALNFGPRCGWNCALRENNLKINL